MHTLIHTRIYTYISQASQGEPNARQDTRNGMGYYAQKGRHAVAPSRRLEPCIYMNLVYIYMYVYICNSICMYMKSKVNEN
jgi:hypothetical protein